MEHRDAQHMLELNRAQPILQGFGRPHLKHSEQVPRARLQLRGRLAHVRRVRVGCAEILRAEDEAHRRLEFPLSDENLRWGTRSGPQKSQKQNKRHDGRGGQYRVDRESHNNSFYYTFVFVS